ncbi:hypothetical protein J3F83DRAFT_605984 [Trichoderma novae-zelandiae]
MISGFFHATLSPPSKACLDSASLDDELYYTCTYSCGFELASSARQSISINSGTRPVAIAKRGLKQTEPSWAKGPSRRNTANLRHGNDGRPLAALHATNHAREYPHLPTQPFGRACRRCFPDWEPFRRATGPHLTTPPYLIISQNALRTSNTCCQKVSVSTCTRIARLRSTRCYCLSEPGTWYLKTAALEPIAQTDGQMGRQRSSGMYLYPAEGRKKRENTAEKSPAAGRMELG